MAQVQHVRISLKGTLPGGEVWSINPTFYVAGSGFVDDAMAAAQSIASAVNGVAVPDPVKQIWGQPVALTGVRVEMRNASFRLLAVAEKDRVSPAAGLGNQFKPHQCALVVSLRTDHPGASGRGRMYLPALGLTLETNLRVSATNSQIYVDAMKDWMKALTTAITNSLTTSAGGTSQPVRLVVHSKRVGTSYDVVRLEIGDVLDTQRRRRDKIKETRYTAAY